MPIIQAVRRILLQRNFCIPRIGIITAELVLQERIADDIEDTILFAAENLSDDELIEYASFVREQKARAADETTKEVVFTENGSLNIEWYKEQLDSNWHRESDISIAPLDLDKCLGRWASKLKSCGILSDDMKERQWEYREDVLNS